MAACYKTLYMHSWNTDSAKVGIKHQSRNQSIYTCRKMINKVHDGNEWDLWYKRVSINKVYDGNEWDLWYKRVSTNKVYDGNEWDLWYKRVSINKVYDGNEWDLWYKRVSINKVYDGNEWDLWYRRVSYLRKVCLHDYFRRKVRCHTKRHLITTQNIIGQLVVFDWLWRFRRNNTQQVKRSSV